MASERLPSRPACLLVASGAAEGVSAQSFHHCFTLASAAFNLQVATPGGKTVDFVDVSENNSRWVQDFRLRAHASPAKLESIDGARYHALLIPSCPGALADLASSGSLARILQHFRSESKPICAVGHGVAALCCATNEDRSWVFQGYSVTGPSVYELVRAPGFAHLPLVVEDFVKDAGASFSVSPTQCMLCWTATLSRARTRSPLSLPCRTCCFSVAAGSDAQVPTEPPTCQGMPPPPGGPGVPRGSWMPQACRDPASTPAQVTLYSSQACRGCGGLQGSALRGASLEAGLGPQHWLPAGAWTPCGQAPEGQGPASQPGVLGWSRVPSAVPGPALGVSPSACRHIPRWGRDGWDSSCSGVVGALPWLAAAPRPLCAGWLCGEGPAGWNWLSTFDLAQRGREMNLMVTVLGPQTCPDLSACIVCGFGVRPWLQVGPGHCTLDTGRDTASFQCPAGSVDSILRAPRARAGHNRQGLHLERGPTMWLSQASLRPPSGPGQTFTEAASWLSPSTA